MGFVHASLLWGMALVGIPILIYLFSRRWYQRRRWAAMEFLLRAMKKHRRRLQIENLLLLLIRISAVLLLALAVARPFLKSTAIGPIAGEEAEGWIFAIDSSASMGFREGPRSLFEAARDKAADMIQSLVRPRDQVAIMTLDDDPRVIVPPTPAAESNRPRLIAGLDEIALGTRSMDLTRSLGLLRELASRFDATGSGPGSVLPQRIVLLSDFQRKDWISESGPKDPAALGLIQEIQVAGGTFALGDLKGSDRNLSVLELSASPEVIARDVWVQFRATVRNWGREDFEKVEVIFTVDGREEAGMILRVPAGETVATPFVPYRFAEAGYHAVTAEVRSDGLSIDNRRFLALRVREDARILLVDGDPSGGPLERETLHLRLALSPDPVESGRPAEGRTQPYVPEVRGADQLDDADPREYALVVLANVGSPSETFLRELKTSVRDGGALMVFLGKNVDPEAYNRQFLQEAGLLPGPLREVLGDSRASFHLVPGDRDHPLTRYFEERREVTSLFEPVVEFRQFIRCDLPGEESGPEGSAGEGRKGLSRTRVAFRFSDPARSPAVFDAGFGQGRAMWIATTADTEWNEFAKWPDFVAFLYESIPYLVRQGEAKINLAVGEPFRQVFEAAEYAPACFLIPPDSTGSFSKAMTKLEGENRFAIVHEETWAPGIYELRLSRPGPPGAPGKDSRQVFAVNIDPREGDLRPILPEDLASHFPTLKAKVFDVARELEQADRQRTLERGTELWRPALWAALLLLLAETAVAQFLGRRGR